MRVRILTKRTPTNTNVRVRVRFKLWQNAHVRAMCVRPKIECANVRACEAKNRRNSQIANLKCIICISKLYRKQIIPFKIFNGKQKGLSEKYYPVRIFSLFIGGHELLTS